MPDASPTDAAPRVPLSRERVLQAAIAIADANGLGALSMRKLAQGLGVEAMSLYNHVQNKGDLLDGMVDLVVAEIELPEPGADWRAAMRRRAISAHSALVRHRWATSLIVSRINVGSAMLRYVDATLGCLRGAGFSPAMADHAWNAIDNHVYGFTLQELNFPFEPGEYAEAAANYVEMIPADQFPHLFELTAEVMSGRHDGVHDFEFGLGLLLDGLELLRAQA
ncbi:TetR/AcrR family transcriptional regulator [Engelhardtia mirabilis]|uniref:Tetracycline repressor protein class H n=1 Tax=Engelhardtia mirabilis TaxID=2528011 RepID=A0A518BQR3_9BACT|nr:Tetracycline repressor protein class H [Planctomycetes bacterium Pla133]QDV03649.1 Tetracycline repressor protein class H [Planctomycetes bacterium Pla86]